MTRGIRWFALAMGMTASLLTTAMFAGELWQMEKKAAEFSSTTLDEKGREDVIKSGFLRGIGDAEYTFEVPSTGWYELYVTATQWRTDLFLDGNFLIHTPFESGVWENTKERGNFKVLNLYLTEGAHALRFSRPWHPGLPYMTKFSLVSSKDLTGMVSLELKKDHLVFRKGEEFPATLVSSKSNEKSNLVLTVTDVEKNKELVKKEIAIPAGDGNHNEALVFPTTEEGVFDVKITDAGGNPCDRIVQYLVIDTKKNIAVSKELKKELVGTIDAAKMEPDYFQGRTRVVDAGFGCYRESGDRGREMGMQAADWFAYKLDLPVVQEPYLLEIEYPDDDRRTCPIVLCERYGPSEPALGYFSGGVYPLSGKMLVQEFYFFPRDKDPRLIFYNWDSGQRAAVSKVNIYRITEGFPVLDAKDSGRLYGIYQEEPLRYLNFYGAMPEGDKWSNLWKPAERVGQLANYAGINMWNPTIAVYQSMLWPGKTIPGYEIGILPPGPATLKEPIKKDVMRLMLLTCEKYRMKFVGDVFIPPNVVLMEYLDKRFGGQGTLDDDNPRKPWLTVSNQGEFGQKSNHNPYYNSVHPGVQEWVSDVFREIAQRYKDSPAFEGISMRFMGWCFGGFQSFASINWGYEDYTIGLFEKETGIKIPVDKDTPERFKRRYEYLMSENYDEWVDWRCRKIADYHKRLANILTDARPDIKFHLFLCDANFGGDATSEDYETKGWAGVLKETGIDPSLYSASPSVRIYGSRSYPDGGNRGDDKPLKVAESRDQTNSTEQIKVSERSIGDGTVAALYFGTNHEGTYMTFEKLGYSSNEIAQAVSSDGKTIFPDATVNPAGIHYLERFANAMADGNIVWLSDGNHGYELGQPMYLRKFLPEYRALPDIGMKALGNTDPVALWHGKENGKTYFYVVNRTYYPVEAEVSFAGAPQIKRITTDEKIITENNALKIKLDPYQMISYHDDSGVIPKSINVKVPEKEKDALKKLIENAENLIKREMPEITILPISPVDMKNAEKKITEAKKLFEEGKYWKTRQALLHRYLIKAYEALESYPEGLFHRKMPGIPEKAMLPDKIMENAKGNGGGRVADAGEITKALSGTRIFICDDETKFSIDIPYRNKYRIWYSSVTDDSFQRPLISIDGGGIEAQGINKDLYAEGIISKPVAIGQGIRNVTTQKGDKKSSLFYLLLDPVYRDIEPDSFMVIGPFPTVSDTRKTEEFSRRMDEVLGPEKELDFTKAYEGLDNKAVKWRKPVSGSDAKGNLCDPHASNYVDLYTTFGMMSGMISYATASIESPDERDVEISFGVDYWAKVWLNGELVLRPFDRPIKSPGKGEMKIPAKLKKGENIILMKIHAGNAGNGFWLAISDPGDLKILQLPQALMPAPGTGG
ncbi:MAG: family 10 glycosylhydrolase [Victivallales bacterium]|nr:family 10 glycosylhydrolase [Victivallales bacterium]